MRYFWIFFITFIIAMIILFYNPYLAVYNDKLTIYYDFTDVDHNWSYMQSNNNIKIADIGDNKWELYPVNNGKTEISFYYKKVDNDYTYKIVYIFKVKKNKIYWLEGEGYGLINYPNPY